MFQVKNQLPSITPIAPKQTFNTGGQRQFNRTPIEDGWYTLGVTDFTPVEKDGKSGFKFTFEITSGTNKGRKMWLTSYPYNYPRQQMTLTEFLKTIGFSTDEITKIFEAPELLAAAKGYKLMGKAVKKGEYTNLEAFAPDPTISNGTDLLAKYTNGQATVTTISSPASAKLL